MTGRRFDTLTAARRWQAGAVGALAAAVVLAPGPDTGAAAAPAVIVLSPLPRQVAQRVGYVPSRAHEHEPGGPALGQADVPVELELTSPAGATLAYRTVLLKNA